MSPENELSRESAVRAQEAIVRALTEELSHLDPESPAAAGLRTQLVEEAGRLAFRVASADAAPGPVSTTKAAGQTSADARRRPRILVVEDDDGTRMALAGWLDGDYEVVTARDGHEGFTLAHASPPDVIVTDLWMPRVDGMSMVNRLRRLESMRTIPVIFLTGQTASERDRSGISSAAMAYLPKPIDLETLERALRDALQQTGALAASSEHSQEGLGS
jgi:CheY-like chemotaxis protein